MSMPVGDTELERQIRSQPEALHQVLTSAKVQEQVGVAAHGLHRARRIWLVGTGTSLHAAELGAAMIHETGRSAQAVASMHFVDWAPIVDPRDGVLVITHTAETAYAIAAAREMAAPEVRAEGNSGSLILYTSEQAHSSIEKGAIAIV